MQRPSHLKPAPPKSTWWDHATFAAFLFATALVVARALMQEIIREPFEVMPDSPIPPRGCGAAGSLCLDLLACLPFLLIIARRTFDREYSLRPALSFIPLGLLAFWTALSPMWSSDKFLAAVAASRVVGAVALAFAASQLVRSWTRFRIATALGLGLLLAYSAQGVYYRTFDLPDVQKDWTEHREIRLKQNNLDPDTFAAKQFEKKLMAGEMIGFFSSPNSFAAVTVLCLLICAAHASHRLSYKDGPLAMIPYVIAAAGAGYVLYYCRSRTSLATLLLGLIALALLKKFRFTLSRHSRFAWLIGVGVACLFAAIVITYGYTHGNLTHFAANTLTFRWKYWAASARMFFAHPLAGVGYANFGPHYLRYRLPEAAEEINDPHNFLVRTFTELGVVGGFLLLAWLLRVTYELAHPLTPASPGRLTRLRPIIGLAIVAMAINMLFAIDFSQSFAWIELECIKRFLFFLLFLFGVLFASLRSLENTHADDRPAPWILSGLLIALLLFALHNTIDFSVFETGPLYLVFFLGGCALGMRTSAPFARRPRAIFAGIFAAGSLAWIIAAVAFVLPIIEAETHAHQAEDFTRVRRFVAARDELYEAMNLVPYNSAYAAQAFHVLAEALAPPDEMLAVLDQAIHLNPALATQYYLRAQVESTREPPDRDHTVADMNRVIELNPNDVQLRLTYAAMLEHLRLPHDAAEQLRAALRYNDLLDPTEPKRLSERQIASIRASIAALESGG